MTEQDQAGQDPAVTDPDAEQEEVVAVEPEDEPEDEPVGDAGE